MKYLGILRDTLIALVGIFLLIFFLSWSVIIIVVLLLGFVLMRLVVRFRRPSGEAKEVDDGVYDAEFSVEEQTVVKDD